MPESLARCLNVLWRNGWRYMPGASPPVGSAAATAQLQQQACPGPPGAKKSSDFAELSRIVSCPAGSGVVQLLQQRDMEVAVRWRALPLPSLLHFGKRFPVHGLVDRYFLQLGPLGNEVEGPVEDLCEALAVVAQALHPDLRALSPAVRPTLEQIEEPIEQLAIGVAQQLVADVAELGRVPAERLRGIGRATRLLQRVRRVAAHLPEEPQVLAQAFALIGARSIILEERVVSHRRIQRIGENTDAFLGGLDQLVALEVELGPIRERLGQERRHRREHVADLLGSRLAGGDRRACPAGQAREVGLQISDQRLQLAAHQGEDHQHAPGMRHRRRGDVAERAQGTERGEQPERVRLPLLLVVQEPQPFQQEHGPDTVVLGAELQRRRRAEVARDVQLVLQGASDVEEERLWRSVEPQQVVEDALVRDQSGAKQEQRFFRRALLAQLGPETRPGTVVGQRSLHEVAEQKRLLLPLLDQLAGEVHPAVDGVARRLQLLLPVPLLGRLDLAEEVAQVEEPIDATQQHLHLEEDLLAAADLQAADPALALGQIDGAHPLGVAHQLEEEVLRESALFPRRRHQSSDPCRPAGTFLPRCSNARWVATRPRGVRAR